MRAIHCGRLVLLELGRRTAAAAREGGVGAAAVEDIWFVVHEEFDAYLADPASFGAAIAERRAMRARLAERVPPFVFEGEPPPWETWERRPVHRRGGGGSGTGGATGVGDGADGDPEGAADRPGLPPGTVLRGLAGSPGVVRGTARVVLHPADVADLEPGDVLVAPITDPSWTPLFVPSAAVVVDVGALDLPRRDRGARTRIPAVVSVAGATRTIQRRPGRGGRRERHGYRAGSADPTAGPTAVPAAG